MKKLAFAAFAALIALVSCNKEVQAPEEDAPVPAKTGATITIKARTAETRTHIIANESGENVTYTAHWDDEGEALGLILTPGAITASDAPAELPGTKVGGEMVFSASGLDYEDGTYNMFVFSPFEAFNSVGDGYIIAELKGAQNPINGSFDPKADLLGYATDGVVIADGQATIENIELMRPMAILRVNLLTADNSDPAFGETVTDFSMELPSLLPLTGKIKITSTGGVEFTEPESAVIAHIAATEEIKVGAAGDAKAVYLVVAPITIPQSTPITFTISTENFNGENALTYTFPAKVNMELESGKVNTIDLKISGESAEARYAGGTGVENDPWLVATTQHMLNMAEDLTSGETKYFKLIDDIDMDGIEWPMLNAPSPYDMFINLDGDNHTVSNLNKSLFYVFKGHVEDLILDNSDVTTRGIFAEYCQGSGHTISNVTISNGKISAGENVGAFIGRVNNGSGTVLTMTDCTVSQTTVTGSKTVGGVIGFADQLVVISGCKFTGGTVTCSGQYSGGFLGSTGNYASTLTNCQVESSTINANCTEDARCGGFVGQLQNSVTISGCSVGTSSTKVVINTKEPTNSKVINAGGFVGVCYGKITKNGDVRSKAYAKITSANTLATPLKLGGFVGYHAGNIEYSDAIPDMTSLKGQHIGGFAGYVIHEVDKPGTIDNCTVEGQVTGNNFTGGFIGYLDSGAPEISNCTASGSVTAQSGCGGFVGQTMTGIFTNCSTSMTCAFTGSNNGGFTGQIHGGTLTGCSSSGSVTATGSSGSTYGGFVGLITNSGTTLDKCFSSSNVTNEKGSYNAGFAGAINNGTTLIKRCYANGNITSNQTYAAGFIGNIHHASNAINVTIENCFSTGDIINSNQIRGGFIAQVATVTSAKISNCYSAGAVVGSFRLGGLIGNVNNKNVTIENCAAWNSEVTASNHGQTNWSSGAIIGTAHPNCHVSNCFRNPNMSLTVYCPPPATDWDHPDINGTTHPLYQNSQVAPFTWAESTATSISAGSGNVDAGRWAYHGKHVASGTTLSQLASTTLGWSADIWDFSGPLPLLK